MLKWIFLICILCLAAFVLLVSYGTYRVCFYNANKVPDDPYRLPVGEKYDALKDQCFELIGGTLALPFEPVTIRSRDGLQLFAKLYRTDPKMPVVILMHGWHGIAERDFSAGTQIHLYNGLNVLLADQRAHQKSEGHTITFGIKERYDCLDWIGYVQKTFGTETPILIHGVSMGAATVLMAAGLPLPEQVCGVIADSPYTTPAAIIKKVTADKGFPPAVVFPFVRLGSLLFGHMRLQSASALEAVSRNRRPVMLIHGTGDAFVPCEMGDALYAAANEPKFQVKVADAPHVLAYMYDKKLYLETLERFYAAAFASYGLRIRISDRSWALQPVL